MAGNKFISSEWYRLCWCVRAIPHSCRCTPLWFPHSYRCTLSCVCVCVCTLHCPLHVKTILSTNTRLETPQPCLFIASSSSTLTPCSPQPGPAVSRGLECTLVSVFHLLRWYTWSRRIPQKSFCKPMHYAHFCGSWKDIVLRRLSWARCTWVGVGAIV